MTLCINCKTFVLLSWLNGSYLYNYQRKRKLDELESRVEETDKRRTMLRQAVAQAKVGKEDTVGILPAHVHCLY